MSVGYSQSCALDTSGAISCWGSNEHGLIDNTPSGTFASVTAGAWHNCALDTAGAISCWGYDEQGQVSDAPASP